MLNTKDQVKVKRLPARPRMNTRQVGDGESWRCVATMWYDDAVRLVGPEPTGACERDPIHGCPSYTRRPCEACADRRDWESNILGLVAQETGWRLYSFARGPGYAFASAPSIYRPRKRPAMLRVTWSGGLDI